MPCLAPCCHPVSGTLCHDCNAAPATVSYVLGAERCRACAEAFDAANREKARKRREEQMAILKAHTAKRDLDGHCPDDGSVCPECCVHDDLDHGICPECESDLSDALAARAEYLFAGER